VFFDIYIHHRLNRLTTVQAGTANHVYSYTGVNPLVQSLTRPNGSVTTYQYNGLNQLIEITNKTSTDEILKQHVFTYNSLDLRGSETIMGSALPSMPSLPEETRDYDYNVVNQLLSITNPNLTFVYDDDGNMTQGYVGCSPLEGGVGGYSPLEGGVGGCSPFTTTYDAEDRSENQEIMKVKKIIGQCPGGTHERSPVIDGWGREIQSHASRRDSRTQGHASRSSVPPGRCEGGDLQFPAMNHWATLRSPSGARPLQNALSSYVFNTHHLLAQRSRTLKGPRIKRRIRVETAP
jgi:YD repeat-containing protein